MGYSSSSWNRGYGMGVNIKSIFYRGVVQNKILRIMGTTMVWGVALYRWLVSATPFYPRGNPGKPG